MPIYRFKNTETDEEWEDYMGISARESYLADNPHIKQMVTGCAIISGTGDSIKPDAGFNDMMGRIARANPTSKMADTYGDKGIKQTKIREVVKAKQKKFGIKATTD